MTVSEVNQDIPQESEFMPQRELEKWLRQHSAISNFLVWYELCCL